MNNNIRRFLNYRVAILSVAILICALYYFANKKIISHSQEEVYGLSSQQLKDLQAASLQSTWRIWSYYAFAVKDKANADKWEKIAREIERASHASDQGTADAKPDK